MSQEKHTSNAARSYLLARDALNSPHFEDHEQASKLEVIMYATLSIAELLLAQAIAGTVPAAADSRSFQDLANERAAEEPTEVIGPGHPEWGEQDA